MTSARNFAGSCSNSTRGLWGGGRAPGDVNIIDYITIATLGNAQDFGDLTNTRAIGSAASSSTRGVFSGGIDSSTPLNTMDFITIATTGNAADFGDLSATTHSVAGCSNGHGGL